MSSSPQLQSESTDHNNGSSSRQAFNRTLSNMSPRKPESDMTDILESTTTNTYGETSPTSYGFNASATITTANTTTTATVTVPSSHRIGELSPHDNHFDLATTDSQQYHHTAAYAFASFRQNTVIVGEYDGRHSPVLRLDESRTAIDSTHIEVERSPSFELNLSVPVHEREHPIHWRQSEDVQPDFMSSPRNRGLSAISRGVSSSGTENIPLARRNSDRTTNTGHSSDYNPIHLRDMTADRSSDSFRIQTLAPLRVRRQYRTGERVLLWIEETSDWVAGFVTGVDERGRLVVEYGRDLEIAVHSNSPLIRPYKKTSPSLKSRKQIPRHVATESIDRERLFRDQFVETAGGPHVEEKAVELLSPTELVARRRHHVAIERNTIDRMSSPSYHAGPPSTSSQSQSSDTLSPSSSGQNGSSSPPNNRPVLHDFQSMDQMEIRVAVEELKMFAYQLWLNKDRLKKMDGLSILSKIDFSGDTFVRFVRANFRKYVDTQQDAMEYGQMVLDYHHIISMSKSRPHTFSLQDSYAFTPAANKKFAQMKKTYIGS